jgi:hypothetical protein
MRHKQLVDMQMSIRNNQGSQKKHDWLQQKVFNTPHKFSVCGPIKIKAMEYQMFNEHGYLVVVPDVYVWTDRAHHYLEVKSSDNRERRHKGYNQLEKALILHRELHKDPATGILVTPRRIETYCPQIMY